MNNYIVYTNHSTIFSEKIQQDITIRGGEYPIFTAHGNKNQNEFYSFNLIQEIASN